MATTSLEAPPPLPRAWARAFVRVSVSAALELARARWRAGAVGTLPARIGMPVTGHQGPRNTAAASTALMAAPGRVTASGGALQLGETATANTMQLGRVTTLTVMTMDQRLG